MRLSVTIALVLLLFGPDAARSWDDHPRPHHAEAERKALAASRLQEAARRETLDPNQNRFDTGYIELDIAFDPVGQTLDGAVTHHLTVTDGPISNVVLDLDGALQVDAVGADAIGWNHLGDLLTLDLDRPYLNGETVTAEIQWSGTPDPAHAAFGFDSAAGKPLIWSLSEPYGARTWFPVKDTPSDKADSASIAFTVPAPMIAVSNGALEQVVALGDDLRYEWFEGYPIAIYLISVAAHEYVEQSVIANTLAGPVPVVNWSYSTSSSLAASNLASTHDMILAFETAFGPYPFLGEKYGQAQFNWGGGMEHQTATSICCWGSAGLTAHELGHQWFGDQVTCDSFTEIWVNEGFATYTAAYWQEVSDSFAAYQDAMLAARYLGPGTVRVPESDLDDTARIFDGGLSYDKGSWVLHMLRGVMGDPDFFDFLTAYTSDPAVSYGTATTADVQRVAEAVSGLDLQGFFDQWVDTPWYPTYAVQWSQAEAPGGWEVTVTLEQLQTHHVFSMPVQVRIHTTGPPVDTVIQSDEAVEQVVVPVPDAAITVEVDPNHWVLHAVEPALPAPSFDRGVLLVNGVDIAAYGSEIRTSLSDSAFTGHQPFEFWNLFAAPPGGYPAGLPAPRGEGALPADVLDDYSTVVWVGNDYNGDAAHWVDAAILDYLQAGGNVVLLARLGRSFLTQMRLEYLGGQFESLHDRTINDATPALAGMGPMSRTASQSLVDPLTDLTTQPETTVLLRDASVPSWVLGLWRQPVGGGSLRSGGGHFVHLAGRPYRWNHVQLRDNMEFILANLIHEPELPTGTGDSPMPLRRTGLVEITPNPFNPRVQIGFRLARDTRVDIEIYDLRGRRIRSLLGEWRPAGPGATVWDGNDDRGRAVASGVYTVRLAADGTTDHDKITLVR
jgi:hypothetical protein